MSTKKKAVKKSLKKIEEPKPYVSLSRDDFEKIYDFFYYKNSVDELDSIKNMDDDCTKIEMSFIIGSAQNKILNEFNEMTTWLDSIKPVEEDEEDNSDYDY